MKTRLLSVALVAAASALAVAASRTAEPTRLAITALSTDAQRVTGGDVLVQVMLPAAANLASLKVTANGKDVTAAFRETASHIAVGLVDGLANGRNAIEATAHGAHASLEVTNYPITGPVISGPWQQPFICQTDAFKLPDGSTLGAPLDANCSAKTVVQYVYWSPSANGGKGDFTPLADPKSLPSDVVKTTTMDGETVNFVVRVETGTMNRGIYQNTILH